MTKLIIVLFFAFSFSSFGSLIPHQPGSPIQAEEVNSNFNYIKNLMQTKNIPLTFSNFESGSIISFSQFEEEFDKVRALGIDVNALGILLIKSVELNTAFAQMEAGANSFNWPFGDLGDLTIISGQTVSIPAGSVLDYDNITINSGGTLNISGNSGAITIIGVRGNLVNNGIISGRNNSGATQTFNATTPLGLALSYSITQSNGGAGGAGVYNGSAGGAAGTLGYGGGGGSGGGSGFGGAGGTNGGNGGNGPGGGIGGVGMSTGGVGGSPPDQTPYSTAPRHGGAGGGSGGGASWTGGYSGGGGGGGGNKGNHGVGLYIHSNGGITGTGSINLSGTNGYAGGRGGGGAFASAGGGGGGAGGSGGKLWIRTKSSFSMTRSVNGGSGGAAGSYFTAQSGNPGIAGSNGVNGSVDIQDNIP